MFYVLKVHLIYRKHLVSFLQPGSVSVRVRNHLGNEYSQLRGLAPSDVEPQLSPRGLLQNYCAREELGQLIVVVGVVDPLLWSYPFWRALVGRQEHHGQLVVIIWDLLVHRHEILREKQDRQIDRVYKNNKNNEIIRIQNSVSTIYTVEIQKQEIFPLT